MDIVQPMRSLSDAAYTAGSRDLFADGQSPQAPPMVLVADDNAGSLLALESVLESLGAEVVGASSGKQVLALMKHQDFAAVLLDVSMPDMDGFEVAELIRQDPRSKATPILFVSGFTDEKTLERAYGLGAVDYLQKPIVPFILRAKVKGFIELARQAEVLRHQAEQIRLLNSELQQRGAEQVRLHTRMLESMTEGVSLTDDTGHIVYVNPAEERMFGYEPGELIGKHVTAQNAYPSGENSRIVEAVIAELQAKGAWQGEWHNKRKDGTAFFTESRITGVELSGRKFWMCVQEDITARKTAEAALRSSETRFRTAVSAVSGLLWTNDASGEMHGEQPGWAAYTGQTYDEYQGYGWADAVHPADAPLTLEAWKKAVAERAMFVAEHRVRRHDGVYRLFSVRALPVFEDSGEIREWVGVHTDITEERQLLRAVRESEARFRTMADSAPVLIWMADTTKQCIWFNRPWLEFTGRTAEQEHGFGWTDRVHPDDLQRCLDTYIRAFDKREPFQMDYRLRRHDDEWRWVLDHGTPRFGQDGRFTGYIGSCIDITERNRREVQLALLADAQDDLARLTDPNEIMQVVGSRIGKFLGVNSCSFCEVDATETYSTIEYTWNESDDSSLRQRYRLADFLTNDFQEACRAGRAFAVEDTRADPRTNAAAYAAYDVRSFLTVPFRSEGRWHAHLGVSHTLPRRWRADEIEFVQELANRTFPRIERARAEAALRESEERLRRGMEIDTVAIMFFNLDGTITRANEAFLRMSGYTRDEMERGPLRWDRLTPADWAPVSVRTVDQLSTIGTATPYEKEYVRPDGSRWWGLFAPRMISEREGVEFILDISERKRVEQQLKGLAEAALEIAAAGTVKDVLRVITEHARLLVGAHRARVTLLAGDNWAQAVNHVSLSEKYTALHDYEQEPDGSGIYALLCRMSQPMRMTQQELENDPEWKSFGEHAKHHPPMRGWLGVPLKAHEGHNLGLIQLSDKYEGDFTESDQAILVQLAEMGSAAVEARRLTHSLQESNRELARTNRELEEFAFVASHDLQEPLRMVNVYTQQLLRRFVPDHPDAHLYAKFISHGVKGMQGLIEDLLEFSRAVHADTLPAAGAADLSAALVEATSVLRERIEEAKAEIVVEDSLPVVFGDTNQLAHVFQNLLSNALKYRKPEVDPVIRISSTQANDEWIISLRDNGIGFDQRYAERIFGLFKRLHKDAYPGTGLGLAICQRIVERYSGRMWAEGRPGEGSTFFFALRVADDTP